MIEFADGFQELLNVQRLRQISGKADCYTRLDVAGHGSCGYRNHGGGAALRYLLDQAEYFKVIDIRQIDIQ